MATKRSAPTEASIAAQEKALLTRIERSKLEIAETEAELANFLAQRKQLDAEIARAVGIERSKLQFARQLVDDECEGSRLLLTEARVALQQAQAEAAAIEARRQQLPAVGARVAAYGRAMSELLASVDELLGAIQAAQEAGVRLGVEGLLPGGGAALLGSRLDLLPRSLPALSMDQAGGLSCRHVAAASASTADFAAELG